MPLPPACRILHVVMTNLSDLLHSGQMTDLLYTEKDLVTSLKDYIRAEENKLERVKRCICVLALYVCMCVDEEFKVADFIMSLESHLICPFCDRWADKLDSLSASATQDPEGFLGHPVNAFKLMKRLNTEWGDLENLVLSDTTDGRNERKIPDSSALRAKKVDFQKQGSL